jgi:RHS repeat-associated protein
MATTDYYVTTDAMGSVMAVLDEAGNVLERRSYDAFGEVTYMLADGTVVPNSPTGVDIGFQGQLMDELTGMYQMGFRWYSPVLGRWVSRDPIGLEGGVNVYTSFRNDSTGWIDPWGEASIYINLTDGSALVITDETNSELRAVIGRLKKGSISSFQINGHGTYCSICTGPNDGANKYDAIVLLRQGGELRVVFSDDTSISLSSVLKDKLSPNAVIRLYGCNTARENALGKLWEFLKQSVGIEGVKKKISRVEETNITKQLSAEFPGVAIVGLMGVGAGNEFSLWFLPEEYMMRFRFISDDVHVFGIHRTYFNGEVK